MKKRITTFITCALLFCTAISCSDTKGNSSSDNTAVTTTVVDTVSEQTTETQTEPTTEPKTKAEVEYYDGLIYPDTLTDKERENTSFREFTMLDPAKCFEIGGRGRTGYGISPDIEKKLKEIRDDIRELTIYDEQLDTQFLSHIILPPDYDENREYPVFLITDSAYWFKVLPNVRDVICEGVAAPVIFVTLGYDYNTETELDDERVDKFVIRQDKFLDFVTEDFMHVISENFKIDTSRSVYFGHSCGGLFADYALCNSDKYEYQPFANYIIGSPAFWNYYHSNVKSYDPSIISDPYAYERDFDYFDRNETMDKNVFICVGEYEDIWFDNYDGDGQTMNELAISLYERLIAHGVDAELKIYEGAYHTDYVEDMLKEYLKQNYPPIN